MNNLNICVIGSGVSGLGAAWLLSKRHRVTLYETANRLGGHANTVDVETADGPVAVDTGFIVYNPPNYPELTALFDHLGVATTQTEMSFAFSRDGGAYEYSSSGANGFFGQRSNAARPRHWTLLGDIARFFRSARERVVFYPNGIGLGEFLGSENYSPTFIDDHIIPMGAAIWSTPAHKMLGFPARSFIEFYANHGLLQYRKASLWKSVTGGSRSYVDRLTEDGAFDIRCGHAAVKVVRKESHVQVIDCSGVIRPFDHVVIATHADQALQLLSDFDSMEQKLLGSFGYQQNLAVLHRDPRWMPQRRRLWSSWNYLREGEGGDRRLCVTYWMNRLQQLNTSTDLFVTLNPTHDIHPKAVERMVRYDHPVFCNRARAAQEQLWALQGRRRTWFCGSYFGYGFHEDGLQSGLAVAEQLGGMSRPWERSAAGNRIPSLEVGKSVAEAAE